MPQLRCFTTATGFTGTGKFHPPMGPKMNRLLYVRGYQGFCLDMSYMIGRYRGNEYDWIFMQPLPPRSCFLACSVERTLRSIRSSQTTGRHKYCKMLQVSIIFAVFPKSFAVLVLDHFIQTPSNGSIMVVIIKKARRPRKSDILLYHSMFKIHPNGTECQRTSPMCTHLVYF